MTTTKQIKVLQVIKDKAGDSCFHSRTLWILILRQEQILLRVDLGFLLVIIPLNDVLIGEIIMTDFLDKLFPSFQHYHPKLLSSVHDPLFLEHSFN